jgi:hypothetical protein
MSNKADSLHYWLSEKQKATRSKLRSAWRGLSCVFPGSQSLSTMLNRLSRGGHVEIDDAGNTYACEPLILFSFSCGAVATGARSLALRRNLQLALPGSQFRPQPLESESWILSGSHERIETIASDLGIRTTPDQGLDILRSLPDYLSILSCVEAAAEIPSVDWEQASWRYRAGRLVWDKTSTTQALGIYRTKVACRWRYVLREASDDLKLLKTPAQLAAALWTCLAGDEGRVLYDSGQHRLGITPGLLPPILFDRALRMASGIPPKRVGSEFQYFQIDINRARECARLLCSTLRKE